MIIRRHHSPIKALRGFTKTNTIAFLLLLLALGAAVGSALYYNHEKNKANAQKAAKADVSVDKFYFWEPVPVHPVEANELVGKALNSLDEYLRGVNIASKAAAVSNGFNHIGDMTSYYATHKFEISLREPSFNRFGMLKVHGVPCLMIVIEFKNKSKWELDFFQDPDDGKWKLDWPAFVRYQPMNWGEFVHDLTPKPEGETFRVWALRQKELEDKDHYAIRFVGPSANGSIKQGVFTNPVMVVKNSDLGKEMYRYLRLNQFQNRATKILSAEDDPDYVRLRVKLSKHADPTTPNKMIIQLDKIIGEGWYDFPPNFSPQ